MKQLVSLLLLTCLITVGCNRKEKCENATVTGSVKHHALIIPNAKVYLKYGSRNAPASPRDPATYDESTTADGSANFCFTNKKEGDYYIYAVGYDDAIADNVYGGVPFTIECKQEVQTVTQNVPVVE